VHTGVSRGRGSGRVREAGAAGPPGVRREASTGVGSNDGNPLTTVVVSRKQKYYKLRW